MSNPSTPFPWKRDARRAGGWLKAKKSEANLRRYAPPPSKGRREKWDEWSIYPLPMKGGCPKGRGLAEGERERSQPPALRATSFQRKEGEAG